MKTRDQYLLERYYNIDNDVKNSYELYLKSIDSYKKESVEYADCILFIMRCELLMGKHQFINDNFAKVLDIYLKNADLAGEFFILQTYGISCRVLNNIAEATLALSKANKISYQINNPAIILASITNYAFLDIENKTPKAISKELTEIQKYLKDVKHQQIIGSYHVNYGYLLFKNGDIEQAKEEYNKAFKAYNEFYTNKSASNLLTLQSNTAEIHTALGQYEKAIKIYREIYDKAKVSDQSLIYECLAGLQNAYQKLGDYENAYHFLKLVNNRLSSMLELTTKETNFSEFNKYLSSELEETKERLFINNLELKKKTSELEENLRQLKLISTIGKQLTSITNESDLFESIVDILYKSIKVTTAALILVNEEDRTVNLKYIVEDDKKVQRDAILSFDNKHSFSAYCAREKTDIHINDIRKEYAKYIENEVVTTDLDMVDIPEGSLIYCRLISDEKLIGILTIQSEDTNAFNESIFETMKAISSYVAIALSNSNKSKLLENLSIYDELTGLKNRRAFVKEYNYLKNNPDSYTSIGLILADMNHLKLVNDNIGHIEGDKHLIKIANILKKENQGHQIFRHGGDEFAIIMIDIEEKEILQYINKVKKACAEENYQPYSLSIAMGYQYSNKTIDFTKFFNKAEDEMYKDKTKFYEQNRKYDRRKSR